MLMLYIILVAALISWIFGKFLHKEKVQKYGKRATIIITVVILTVFFLIMPEDSIFIETYAGTGVALVFWAVGKKINWQWMYKGGKRATFVLVAMLLIFSFLIPDAKEKDLSKEKDYVTEEESLVTKPEVNELQVPGSSFILAGDWRSIDKGILIYTYENTSIDGLYVEVCITPYEDPRVASYTEDAGVNYYGDKMYCHGNNTIYYVKDTDYIQLDFTYKGDSNISIADCVMLSHFEGSTYVGASNTVGDEPTSYIEETSSVETIAEDDLEAEGDPDINTQYSEYDVNEAEHFVQPDYGGYGPSTWAEMCWDQHWSDGVHVDPDTNKVTVMDGNYCPICNGFFE